MQQQHSEVVLKSITSVTGKTDLLKFSKSISERCHEFTKQLLQGFQQQSQQIPDYLTLMQKHFKYKKVITKSHICAKILNVGDYAFKCLKCQNEDNSIICIECFNKSDHKDHAYQKIGVNGGCCDCGDDQKWKREGSCIDHKTAAMDVQLDKEQTQLYVKQLKYIIFLLYLLNFFSFSLPESKKHIALYLKSYATFLYKFNKESMISNEMTFLLFKQNFEGYPSLQKQKLYSIKVCVFQILLRYHSDKEYGRILVDLFILMFTRLEFKKYLTEQYSRITRRKPIILLSQLSNISCQIYTSHKLINQLLDQNKLLPLAFQPTDVINQKFETIADLYCRYYLDLVYLVNLYNNVGQKYTNYHFQNGDISDICGYEFFVRKNTEDSIQYYGIELIMFNRYTEILKHFHSNKQVNKKAITDILKSIKKDNHQETSLYLSKERTLLLLLFIFTDGKIQECYKPQFLKQFQIDSQLLQRILHSVLYVIRFCSLNLANRQTVERYYTFFSFMLNKRPRVVLSIDFELVKFCICSLTAQSGTKIGNIKQISYEGPIIYEDFKISVQDLIALPYQFIEKLLKQQTFQANQEAVYDRRKALAYLSDYIGLLLQILLVNHSQLIIETTYNIKTENYQQKIINFYISMLNSLVDVKLDDFKQICKVFINEQKAIMQKFVGQYCVVENKKIKLKVEKQIKQNQGINLGYLKSKKCCEPLFKCVGSNTKKFGYDKIPIDTLHSQNRKLLEHKLFPKPFLIKIRKICTQYAQKIQKNVQTSKDLPHFQLFLEQLIFLWNVIRSQEIQEALKNIKSKTELFTKLAERIKNQILNISGSQKMTEQNPKNLVDQEKKKKQDEVRNKKLQKLKSKQFKAIDSFKDEQLEILKQQEKQSLLNPICMFCKMGSEKEPLCLLCFNQKSTLFSAFYLSQEYPPVTMISTCNHYVHRSCNKTVNNLKQYIHCNLCKCSSNELLVIQNKQYEGQKESKNMEEQQGNVQKLFTWDNENNRWIFAPQSIKEARKNSVGQNQKQGKRQQKQMHDKNKEEQTQYPPQLSWQQSRIQTVAIQMLYGIIVDYEFFIKSLSKVSCVLLNNLAKMNGCSKISVSNLFKRLKYFRNKGGAEENKMFWDMYYFVVLSICSLLALEKSCEQLTFNLRSIQANLPEDVVESITQVLSKVRTPESLQNLSTINVVKFKPLTLPSLPNNLQELSKNIGQCPNCKTISNEISLCLICSFKSCIGCNTLNLRKHIEQKHGDSSVFVRVDEGWPLYVSLKKNKYMDCLYLDLMRESYSFSKNCKSKKQYILEAGAYAKIRNDIMKLRVEQQVRYYESMTSNVSLLQP